MLPKAPAFWRADNKSVLPQLLAPLSWVYRLAGGILSLTSRPYKSRIPVICIGGAVLGGSGKTPVVHALLPLLEQAGYKQPVILLRGYGGTMKGPTRVDPAHHTAADVGDESLLHAYRCPAIVAADRAAGARLAEAMGADLIIMDDGLQNHALSKDASLLVYDTRAGLGNGHVFPAGPLREPLQSALVKCAAVVTTGGAAPPPDFGRKPVFDTSLSIVSDHDKTRTHAAFAGIGYPEKFRKTLDENGFHIAEFHAFADHHPYTDQDADRLLKSGLPLLTTEKDYVRLPERLRAATAPVAVALRFDDETALLHVLKNRMKERT